jgi:hypothetical protein
VVHGEIAVRLAVVTSNFVDSFEGAVTDVAVPSMRFVDLQR